MRIMFENIIHGLDLLETVCYMCNTVLNIRKITLSTEEFVKS